MYFGFYESPERLIAKAHSVGIDLTPAMEDGRLTVHWYPAVELLGAVRRTNASRLVFDGVDGFHQSANRTERFGLFLNALSHRLREAGVTTVLTEELPLYGDSAPPAMTENIVLMRYIEANSSLYRLVSIVKQREGSHDSTIRRLTINTRGLHISEGFIGPTGLLSGHPSMAPALSVSDPGARA